MNVWIRVAVLLAAVYAAHWGPENLAKPFKKVRR
jgi:cation:H+ antiporter